MAENKEPVLFSKREWIHLIITLSIIQAFIWWVSFQFAGNSSALGYVSFAGTLISIILAVLAIGYTYSESQQQKNSSNALSNQIESLIKIREDLQEQAEALKSIEDLHNSLVSISSKIDGHFQETKHKIDSFNDLAKSFENKKLDNVVDGSLDKDLEKIIDAIFSQKPSQAIKLGLIIVILYSENEDTTQSLGSILKYIRKLNIAELEDKNVSALFGCSANLYFILSRLGAIQTKEQRIHPQLLVYFNTFVKDDNQIFNQSFDGAAAEIRKLAHSSRYYN